MRTEAEIDALRQANLAAFDALPRREYDDRARRLGEVFGVEETHRPKRITAPKEEQRAEFRVDHKKLILSAPMWKPTVLAAINADGDLMQYAVQSLRMDPDFMIEAVKCSVNVLRYADPSLLASPSFMSLASRLALGALDYANDSLLANMEFMHSLYGTIHQSYVPPRVLIAWARLNMQWRDALGSMLETDNFRITSSRDWTSRRHIDGAHSYRELSATGEPKGQTKTIDHGLIGTSARNPFNENPVDAAILTSPEVVKLFRAANVKTSRVGGEVEGVERIQVHLGLTCSTIPCPLEPHSSLFRSPRLSQRVSLPQARRMRPMWSSKWACSTDGC